MDNEQLQQEPEGESYVIGETESSIVNDTDDSELVQQSVEQLVEPEAEPTESAEQPLEKQNDFERQKRKWQQKVAQREQELEYWKTQALGKQSQLEPEVQPISEPTYDGDFEKYTREMAIFAARQALAESAMQKQALTTVDNYRSKLNEFKKTQTDFDEVLDEVSQHPAALNTSQAVLDAIIESDVGPQLTYYLAKNINEIERINMLSPARRLVELGKIESKLQQSAPPSNRVSAAPAPVKPGQLKTPAPVKSLSNMSAQEVADYLDEQEAKQPRRYRR